MQYSIYAYLILKSIDLGIDKKQALKHVCKRVCKHVCKRSCSQAYIHAYCIGQKILKYSRKYSQYLWHAWFVNYPCSSLLYTPIKSHRKICHVNYPQYNVPLGTSLIVCIQSTHNTFLKSEAIICCTHWCLCEERVIIKRWPVNLLNVIYLLNLTVDM